MSITKKQIKAYEDREKKEIYTALEALISEQTVFIQRAKVVGQFLNFDTNIPNIGITFNNKLGELSQEFEQAGISMWAEVNEEYDFIDSNMVGDAIIADMIQQLNTALDVLEKYQIRSSEVSDKKADKVEEFNKYGPIKKFFWKVKALFLSYNQILQELWAKPEEIKEINAYLANFRELDDKLFNYNLKDNVSQSLVKYIKQLRCDEELIQMVIDEQVAPSLNKLGLGNLITEIEEELQPEKKKSLLTKKKSWEMSNWGIDVEYVRKEAAEISQTTPKTKKSKAANELTEK